MEPITRRRMLQTTLAGSALSLTSGAAAGESDYVSSTTSAAVSSQTSRDTHPDEIARGSADGDVVADDATEVAVAVSPPGASFPADGEMQIAVGTFTESSPVNVPQPNETITLEVELPDGSTNTFEVTTDEYGYATAEYDLSGQPGQYAINATTADDTSASVTTPVGTVVEITTNKRGRPVFPGREVTVAALARDGKAPVTSLDVAMTVLADGDPQLEETVTTDADGFAEISFVPSSGVDYEVQAEALHDGQAPTLVDSESIPTTDLALEYDYFDLDPATAGTEAGYGGHLHTPQGPLANEDVTVTFRDETTEEVLVEETTQTTATGFFAIDYEVPEEADHSLSVAIESADGRQAVLGSFEDDIQVRDPPTDDEDEVEVSVSTEEWSYAPGATATAEIEATDADGTPIPDQEVELLVEYNWRGLPGYSETVTTDADGTATVSVPLHDEVPTGLNGDIYVGMEYEGTEVTGSESLSIEELDIRYNESVTAGEESEHSLEVTRADTGDPVEGVSLWFDAQYGGGTTGSYATARLESGPDGTDSVQVPTPDDLLFRTASNYISRETPASTLRVPTVAASADLTVQEDEISPGGTATLSFSTGDGSSASGLVFTSLSDPDIPIVGHIDTESSTTLSIPPEAATESSISFDVWALDDTGTPYRGWESGSVGDDPSPPETPSLQLQTVSVPDVELEETLPATVTVEETAGLTAEDVLLSLAVESPEGVTIHEQSVSLGSVSDQATVTLGEGEADPAGPFEVTGTYTLTITVTAENAEAVDTSESFEVVDDAAEEPSLGDYTDEDGNVSNEGLFEAAGDWRDGEIDNELLFEVAATWR